MARLAAVLEKVGLGALAGELDMIENWSQRLSRGEQQRFAFARILLVEPALLFLDEATSALDEPSEAQLYGLLRAASWRPTVVSVGHRSTLRNFHDHVLDIAIRSANGVSLTERGAHLRERVQDVFAELEVIWREQDRTREVNGTLTLAASTTVARYFLPRIFLRFHHYHPAAALNLLVGNTEAV